MDTGNDSTPHKPAGMTKKSRLGFGITVAIVIVGALLIRGRQMMSQRNNIQTGVEEGTVKLSHQLDNTPKAEKLKLLLEAVNDPSPGIRFAAVDSLAEFKNTAVADVVENAFKDSASTVRTRAVETLFTIDPERGFRLCIAAMQDEDTWVRQAAVMQLIVYGRKHMTEAKRATFQLIALLDDPEPTLPSITAGFLHKLYDKPWVMRKGVGGEERKKVIQTWKEWWDKEKISFPVDALIASIRNINPTRTDPAPEYRLKDVDGNYISSGDQKGKLTFVNFWGTWCPPCQAEVPYLARIYLENRDKGFDMIGIALSEKNGPAGLKKWCLDHGMLYRQAEATDAVTDAFGHIDEVPVSLLIDGEGRIRRHWEGERDYETFHRAIAEVQKGN
ncbi:MAG: redoxin domain-containing protein [Chthonomonadales bacterium]